MAEPLTIVQRLSHYRIRDTLGSGGAGVVYLADDEELQRRVAIKVIRPDRTGDQTARRRFKKEAQAVAALDHANICTIHDIGETPQGELFIVMAHYPGETLKTRIENGPLPADVAIDMASQVARGLEKAHVHGIIHRDIKPSNVIVTPDNVAKILDFGIARSSTEDTMTHADTASGTVVGTVAYMSPEQMSGQVDQRTDLWAVGVMMYEMLAGRRPFSGDTIERVLAAILFRSPFPLPQDCPIEPGLERLVTRALAKDPDERFQTAQEFLEALRAADTTVSVAVQAGAGSTPSIAVLPFADMSEARDQEYFCEGMAEELINALTKLPSIRVAARTSSFRFKHQAVDVRDIGRELNVTSLVEGSVRKFGEHIRIAARLTEVSDGYERWAEQYDREAGNVFLVQDEIARAIVDQLEVRLSGLQSPTLIAPSTQDVDAYKLYLQGRHYWNHRYPGFIEKAIRCFEGAIARDATYALAYTGLADAYVVLGAYGLMEPALSMSKAKQAAERAVALNDGLAEAHHSTALVAWYGDRSWLGTERAFRRALELNPASGVAHAHASVMLGYHGEFDEAVREAEQARQLEPMSAVIGYYTGNAFMLAGQLDEALDEVERSVDLDPNFGMAGWQKVWILRAHGRHQDALVEAERVAALTKRQCIFLATLGVAYAGVGDVGRATAVLDEVVAGADDNHVSPLAAAMICASLGSTDWALDHLERAVAKRVPLLVLLPLHPVFQPLWENPRFEDLTRRIGIWT